MKKENGEAGSSASHERDHDETAGMSKLRAWDPKWADSYAKMRTNPWNNEILPAKEIELICIALEAACTNLNPDGTRRHTRRTSGWRDS